MKKLIFLSLLAIGMTGCSVESMDSEELLTADAKFKTQEAQNPLGFYSGNSDNLKGTVSITNDCDNMYIQIIPNGDDPDGVKLGLFQGDNNPKENGTDSDLENLDMSGGLVWAFPLSGFDELAELRIFVKAWGDYSGTIEWGNKASYFIYEFEEVTCEEDLDCPSGYMFGDTFFTELDETAKNWGWGQEFSLETGEFVTVNIQQKDEVLGEITITLNSDNSVTITEGASVTVTHKYVADVRPTDTAPGQFDKIGNKGDENGDGKFWVMIKADVCK